MLSRKQATFKFSGEPLAEGVRERENLLAQWYVSERATRSRQTNFTPIIGG